MAKSFLTPINLNGLELLNARLQNLATAPTGIGVGYAYYDTTRGNARIYSASGWIDIVSGSTYTDEQAQDAVGALIAAGTASGITVTYDDTNNALNFTVPADAVATTASLRTLGTGSQQAAAGNDSRLSDMRTPTDGSVTNAKVAANAAISADKLADGSTNGVYTLTERSKLASITSDAVATTASLRTLGTGSQQAVAGNDSRLSDARNPLAGSVTNASVSASAAISMDKMADGTTNGVYTLAERSKLSGIQAGATANSTDAYLLNRANQTGTESADVIVDGTTNKAYTATEKTKLAGIASGATAYSDTNARANRLDQFAAPTAAVSMANQLVTNVATPVSGTDAANKNYVDATAAGLDFKNSVVAATVGNITLSAAQTIDGVAVTAGQRVLVKNQTTASQNGLYVVSSGTWTRSTDANSSTNLSSGAVVYVEGGSTNGGTQWVLSTTGTITPDTTAQTWTQFSGASATTAGNGLTASGNTFNVGAGTGISVAADSVGIDTTIVTRKANFSVGDGTSTSFVLTHNLGTRDVMVQVYTNSGNYDTVEPDVYRTSTTQVTISFAVAPASGAYRAVVQG